MPGQIEPAARTQARLHKGGYSIELLDQVANTDIAKDDIAGDRKLSEDEDDIKSIKNKLNYLLTLL